MPRPISMACSDTSLVIRGTSLGDLLTVRPSGLDEAETWAILCQSVQALQDLFLSDGVSGKQCIPLVTPATLKLSLKGRVELHLTDSFLGFGPPAHLAGYLAPEYKASRKYSDTEYEKMWIFSLGETLKRATITSHAATSRLSKDLCRVLSDMTRLQDSLRASLMYLLDVMSEYCKKRQQNRPFSHIVMDLHQEALAGIETSADMIWGPPAMHEMVPRAKAISESTSKFSTINRKWQFPKTFNADLKTTKEVATSMEDLRIPSLANTPGKIVRPKSMCVQDSRYDQQNDYNFFVNNDLLLDDNHLEFECGEYNTLNEFGKNQNFRSEVRSNRLRVRRNPVQRAASRLYRVGIDLPANRAGSVRGCVGPEFVVRASLPSKQLVVSQSKGTKKSIIVILLDGQKLEVTCSPSSTTAGQLLELIIQEEHIEENFMLGLSALIAGDFVFIPSDTRICKVMHSGNNENLTLYLRVKFFLPSLRGIRGSQARHFLYLQLRRSILEHQLPSSFLQIIELNGLALQAEFGNYEEVEHGTRDYFLLEHYVPETMTCIIDDEKRLKEELIQAHISKKDLQREKAEQDFIIYAQNLPHYGGHFYTATWILKDNNKKDIWLYISAQGINLYERGKSTSHFGPQLYEMFEWKIIQTLCYTKHYLSIVPHSNVRCRTKLNKYKLKMDHKKSYFAFRLASAHHQFFLRLRTEYTSLQTLSQQFGIPLKDIKNETNSLCKLEAYNQPMYSETVSADTEFRVEFKSSNNNTKSEHNYYRKTKSVHDLSKIIDQTINEDHQNKENEKPGQIYEHGLVLDSSYFAGLPVGSEKRSGVKMGTRAFSKIAPRASRSMEAVNEYLEQLSLKSMSFHCSSTSISKTSLDGLQPSEGDACVLDFTLKSVSQQNFLPNFQETINETLLERLNNMSFAEERILSTVYLERDSNGSLGLQITEGSDGNVYIQSVITGGPAYFNTGITKGDQVVAVNGQSLLGRKYSESLELLKSTSDKVEFVLSRVVATFTAPGKNLSNIKEDDVNPSSMDLLKLIEADSNRASVGRSPSIESQVEKHNIESCDDLSNTHKFVNRSPVKENDISYRMHRHLIGPQRQHNYSVRNNRGNQELLYKSISSFIPKMPKDNDRAIIVDMIPKKGLDWPIDNAIVEPKIIPLEKVTRTPLENDASTELTSISDTSNGERYVKNDQTVALPRSLGLSRKWKGPVRYPVTPIKKTGAAEDEVTSTSEEEQVFI